MPLARNIQPPIRNWIHSILHGAFNHGNHGVLVLDRFGDKSRSPVCANGFQEHNGFEPDWGHQVSALCHHGHCCGFGESATVMHTEDASSADSEDEGSFVENLQKRCRLAAIESRYDLLSCIPPTSNLVEMFFSVARTTYGQEHHSLQPTTLEMVLFLRQNGEYWTGQDRLSMRPLVNN
ncbi:hypothetical protein GQ600_9643 [Phytophthora cactorum]|nr:hypothetical protein GQ600_9643 [Phytophthora cactorum]